MVDIFYAENHQGNNSRAVHKITTSPYAARRVRAVGVRWALLCVRCEITADDGTEA
jgi:hypothetical protein